MRHLPFYVWVSFFECVFTSFFIISGLVILFVIIYCRYIQDVFGDKSTNLYQMLNTDYNRLLGNKITSNYRKCDSGVKYKVDKETKEIAKSLDFSKKMECYANGPAFITVKDRKPNFRNNTKCC